MLFDNAIDFLFALYDFSLQGNLILNYLNRRNLILFLLTLRSLIC